MADTQQILVGAIIESDMDKSARFSDKEIKMIEIRLQNVQGVTVNFEKLREKLNQSGCRSLSYVLNLMKEIERDDIPDEERIFVIQDACFLNNLKKSLFGGNMI